MYVDVCITVGLVYDTSCTCRSMTELRYGGFVCPPDSKHKRKPPLLLVDLTKCMHQIIQTVALPLTEFDFEFWYSLKIKISSFSKFIFLKDIRKRLKNLPTIHQYFHNFMPDSKVNFVTSRGIRA